LSFIPCYTLVGIIDYIIDFSWEFAWADGSALLNLSYYKLSVELSKSQETT